VAKQKKVRAGGEDEPSKQERFISFKIGDKVYSECIDGNIQLSELTPDEMQNALNRAVGNYAYYGSLRADAKRMQAKYEAEYDAWKAVQYNLVANRPDFAKATGKAIEVQVLVENTDMVAVFEKKARDINMITDKLLVLVNAFELMTKTLQSCLAMARVQLESAGRGGFARGSGDMTEGD